MWGLLLFALVLGAIFLSDLFLELLIGLALLGLIVAIVTLNWTMMLAGALLLVAGALGAWVAS